MNDTQQRIAQIVQSNEVVLFMKGTAQFPMCGFSGRAVQILKACGVNKPATVNVLEDEAIRIAIRESNLKPAARNYCCIGLFQIYFNVHKRWLATIGVTNANQLTDPRVNAYAAVTLWNRAGSWAPWRL